jgi:hypothetical protein
LVNPGGVPLQNPIRLIEARVSNRCCHYGARLRSMAKSAECDSEGHAEPLTLIYQPRLPQRPASGRTCLVDRQPAPLSRRWARSSASQC